MAATEAEVVLGVPETPNLKDLAESTSLAFTILRPWCNTEFKSNSLIVIQKQAQSYVKAIDFSITAAQHGYNVTQEALSFSKLVDSSSEKDRQKYLCGMLEIARQGEQHARVASEKFRNVRSTVGKLILEAKRQDPENQHSDPSASNGLDVLEGSLGALEQFSSCISSYLSWWNVINMSHVAQNTRLDQIIVNYNSLRYKDVVKKWKELGQEYVDYSTKIQSIQDSYPDFALQLKKATSEDLFLESELRDDLDQQTRIMPSPAHNLIMFHFPAPLFAARYREQQTRIRKRDRIRKSGQKIVSTVLDRVF